MMCGMINLNLKIDGMWDLKFHLQGPGGPQTSVRAHCCSHLPVALQSVEIQVQAPLDEDWSTCVCSQSPPPDGHDTVGALEGDRRCRYEQHPLTIFSNHNLYLYLSRVHPLGV